MDLKARKLRIGKYTVPLFLVLIIASVGVVAAVTYTILSYTTAATVTANPKVCFINWQTGSKANKFNYAVEVSPGVTTVDDNITYGIWNWHTLNHTCAINVISIGNQSTNIQSIATYVKLDNVTVVANITFTDGETWPTSPQTFTAMADTTYTISIEITAKDSAIGSSVITYNLRVY